MVKLIIGATASGKSALGMQIARKISGGIVNIDSMQIYNSVPIITAQPTVKDMQEIPHFLYGFAQNNEHFSFGKWLAVFKKVLLKVQNQGLQPIIIGGTMMYAYMLLNGYSPIPEIPNSVRINAGKIYEEIGHEEFLKMVQNLDNSTPKDRQRLVYNYCLLKETGNSLEFYSKLPQIKVFQKNEIEVIAPTKTRLEIYHTCNSRFLEMIENGLLEEVRATMNEDCTQIQRATGFKNVVSYLNGKISKEEMVEKSQQETRNYAKKQIIWLRKFAKEGLILPSSISQL